MEGEARRERGWPGAGHFSREGGAVVKVLFFGFVRDMTGEKETAVEGAPTIRSLFEALATRYGERFRTEALPKGELSSELIVLVNGRHIAHSGGAATPLREEDTVAIFPLVGGG